MIITPLVQSCLAQVVCRADYVSYLVLDHDLQHQVVPYAEAIRLKNRLTACEKALDETSARYASSLRQLDDARGQITLLTADLALWKDKSQWALGMLR